MLRQRLRLATSILFSIVLSQFPAGNNSASPAGPEVSVSIEVAGTVGAAGTRTALLSKSGFTTGSTHWNQD